MWLTDKVIQGCREYTVALVTDGAGKKTLVSGGSGLFDGIMTERLKTRVFSTDRTGCFAGKILLMRLVMAERWPFQPKRRARRILLLRLTSRPKYCIK